MIIQSNENKILQGSKEKTQNVYVCVMCSSTRALRSDYIFIGTNFVDYRIGKHLLIMFIIGNPMDRIIHLDVEKALIQWLGIYQYEIRLLQCIKLVLGNKSV